MIYTVEDRDGLYDALAKATGGDTIRLQAGDYGNLDLWSGSGVDYSYDSPVTITSANSSVPASFSSMRLDGVENLSFDNVVFDYSFDSADTYWVYPFSVDNSSGIDIRNSLFEGDVATGKSEAADGYGFGKGLVVENSNGVTIVNNEFTTWHRAVVIGASQNIVVSGNDIHSVRSDGLNFAGVQSVLIEDNYIHDFEASKTSGDHEDMIQFWTDGTTTPNTDIIIRGNVLDVGDGNGSQSIFMRNEVVDQGLAGSEMFYQNVLIEENVILNGSFHGITVGETNGLTVRKNTLLSLSPDDEDYASVPFINVASASENVAIESNAVGAVTGFEGQDDWNVQNNALIQNTDPNSPGYYEDLFLESSQYRAEGVSGYVVTPGSLLDEMNAGASSLFLDTTPGQITAQFDVLSSTEGYQTLIFDATHTYGPTGPILSEDATFHWVFGDGTTATGKIVEHQFDTVGFHDVYLTVEVQTAAGASSVVASARSQIGISGSDTLSFNASDGNFYVQGYGLETAVLGSDEASVGSGGSQVVDLGGSGAVLSLPKEAVSRLFGADTFEMEMVVRADQPGASWGEIGRIHDSIIVTVTQNGDLSVRLFLDTGAVELTATGHPVNDGQAHKFSVRLDGATDSLQIVIDDVVVETQAVTGSMPGIGHWGLSFGEPWGGQSFDGKLLAFDLDVSSTDYPVFTGGLGDTLPSPSPLPEDETSLPVLDDYVVDFAALTKKELKGDAAVVSSDEGSLVQLDGERDVVNLGKLEQFETARQLSVSAEFRKANADDAGMKLVWNNKNVGLIVEDDGLRVYVAEKGTAFGATGVLIDDLGLDDTDSHQAMVVVDSDTDRLQVILDGAVVYEEQQERNIELTGLGDDKEYNWLIGTQKNEFAGEVYEFMVDADADFVASSYDDSGMLG